MERASEHKCSRVLGYNGECWDGGLDGSLATQKRSRGHREGFLGAAAHSAPAEALVPVLSTMRHVLWALPGLILQQKPGDWGKAASEGGKGAKGRGEHSSTFRTYEYRSGSKRHFSRAASLQG